MRNYVVAGASALALSLAFNANAAEPNAHAPIGVMGDHLHKQGEFMTGYRYEHIRSSGFRDGNHNVSRASVLAAYGEGATEMDMGMHMVELMYGLTDNLTLMVMPQYMQMTMTHQSSHGGGHSHQHSVEGFGDTEVTGLYSLWREGSSEIHANLGLSLPTGSTDETFTNHHDIVYHMPYNMQFGSGTFDPILGLTYTSKAQDWSWGAQTVNTIRQGKNDEGYRQGNKYSLSGWVARNVTEITSLSFRLEGEAWGNVSGRDFSLPLTTIAGADPNQQAGERVLAYVGLNLLAGKGHRLAAEFGLPIHERYEGPQPATDYRLTLGWQWGF